MMLNLTIGWTVLVFLLALRDSLRLWTRFRQSIVVPRWLVVLLPLAGALMLTMIWVRIARSPYDSWNGARTAPIVAWTKGMPLYFSKGQGPASAFIHGPIAAIVRLPAAIAKTPTNAILIADLINASLFFIPAILFLLALPCKSNLMRGTGLLVFAGFSLTLPSLLYSAFMVHADAPAVGFGLLACALLVRRASPNLKWPILVATAVCAVFSTAAKQNMLPIIFLLPIFLYVQNGLRDAIILALLEMLGLAVVAGVSILAFGYEPLRFTMFGIVAGHMKWLQMYGKPMSWELGVGFLIADIAAPAIAMAIALLIESCRTGTTQSKMQWLVQRPWMMPLTIALFMIPSSIVGRVKPGGAENALTPTTYFLVAALAGWIVSHHPRVTENGSEPINRIVIGASALFAISLGILCANPTEKSLACWTEIQHLSQNPDEMAYQFSLTNPGKAYFPWNPLATLMSENQYYVFDYGAVDLFMAGDFISDERLRQYTPADMEYVIYPANPESESMHRRLSNYSKRVALPDLPGWNVYVRPEGPP